ncbi:hypothetical protein [Micromonospora sp. CA-248212]|uniref:hypothetical protein n=1 Tax=Micromonospora sp. CA-248212 TaxID=3239961 RepID=UPI003D942A9C
MTEIKPIETQYAGCRFRSRLEARWAVFFDHLNIEWQYETEGYTLSTGDRYLPDFYLPDSDQWVEVKGKVGHADLLRMLVAAVDLPVVDQSQIRPGVLVLGPIPKPGQTYCHPRLSAVNQDIIMIQHMFFTQHSTIKPIGLAVLWQVRSLLASSPEVTAEVRANFAEAADSDDLALYANVDAAYRAARSARFEHGESGATPVPRPKPVRAKVNPGVGYLRGTLVRLEETYDLTTVDGRVGALREMAPVLAAVVSDDMRREWTSIVAVRLGLGDQVDAVERAVTHHRR